jgi:hypothetical protein
VTRLGFDDVIANRVTHQLADGVAIEPPHDVGAMGFRGFYAEPQGHSHFFAALAFSEELYDLSLSRS